MGEISSVTSGDWDGEVIDSLWNLRKSAFVQPQCPMSNVVSTNGLDIKKSVVGREKCWQGMGDSVSCYTNVGRASLLGDNV